MKKIKDNRRGSTLVEVIVTFALIGMFLLAATTAVSAAMNAFYRMESLSRVIVVSDTILDKAQGELSLASADGALLCLGGSNKEYPAHPHFDSHHPLYKQYKHYKL